MTAAEIAQDPARWLELRRQGITATDAATIMGVSPWDSPFALWHRKAGNLPEVPDNDRFRLARYLEEYVWDRWREVNTRYGYDDGGLFRDGWRLATPDYLAWTYDADSLALPVECKTVASWDGWTADTVPAHVRVQVLWQCAVLDVPVGHVAALHRQSGEFRSYVLDFRMDDGAGVEAGEIAGTCERFHQSLVDRTPPPVDGAEATTAALRALHPAANASRTVYLDRNVVNDWEDAREYAAHYAAQLEQARNRVREQMGDAKYARYIDEEDREWRIAQRIQSKIGGYWVGPYERDELRYGRKQISDGN